MGEKTDIAWCDHTFNPFIGCSKVSAGCAHCYAETIMDTRLHKVQWGPQGTRIRTSATNWKQPLAWDRKAARNGVRRRVFCASLADVFEDHPSIQSEWRTDLFYLIMETPNLDWLLLTKRPQNILSMVPDSWDIKFPDNVWMGTTVEDQEAADERIPLLMKVPAKFHFLSVEPMLGPVYIYNGSEYGPVEWVICGGETGREARAMREEWVLDLRWQAQILDIPFFFKQWGTKGGDPTQHNGGDLLQCRQYHQFPDVDRHA